MEIPFSETTYCKLTKENVEKLIEQNFTDSRYCDIERDISIGNIFVGIEVLDDNKGHITTFETPNVGDVFVKLSNSGFWSEA